MVIKLAPSEDPEAKAKQDTEDRNEKRQFDRDTIWLGELTTAIIFLQLLIFGLQAYYLGGTLKATARAADAAALSARVARDSLVAVQRAFVYFKGFSWVGVENNKKIVAWRMSPQWGNSGQTATKNIVSRTNWRFIEAGMPLDFDFPDEIPVRESNPVIGPNGVVEGHFIELSVDDLTKIKDAKTHFYVWAWADYNDVFPDTVRHRTEWAVEIKVFGDPSERQSPSNGNIRFAFLNRFNGADDQCYRNPAPYVPPTKVA